MATFPRTEGELAALARDIISGVRTNPELFAGIDVAGLESLLADYQNQLNARQLARAEALRATDNKNAAQELLTGGIRKAIRQAELDNFDTPLNLVFIGWGPRAEPDPIAAPAAPSNLRATDQQAGQVSFSWDKPRSGGAVRNYCLYRTTADPESGLGRWTLVDFCYSNEVTLSEQPRGVPLYYMINAVNAGGTSPNSNTLAVVL